jgi:AcrR family transcriptional regulator
LKRLFVPLRTPDETRTRLLEAGAELFAAQGFHGTTVREITERARVNLAAGHYHFGSKRELYLEVFRTHFARVRDELRRRGAAPDRAQLAHLSPHQAAAVLRERIRAMVDQVIASTPALAPLLMQREMADPTEALPVIVREFIRPMMDELEDIVARLASDLDEAGVTRSAMSIVGQVLFYQFAKPAVLRVLGEPRYTQEMAGAVADHITAFSLGGLAAAGRSPERRRARAR